MARVLTAVAIALSLVAFYGQEHGSPTSWTHPLARASYLLLVLALLAALVSERRASENVLRLQVVVAALAIVFLVVAAAKYYGDASLAHSNPFAWTSEARRLGLGAIPLALTLTRRRSDVGMAALAVAVGVAIGSAIFALALGNANTASFLWWAVALTAALLGASVAGGLERGSVVLSVPVTRGAGGAPVAGGAPASDPGVE